uniref:Uncharacterized protein n=1 Tax=Panagrolaimus sp. ES5 TaxID=591445 RepID=A0AC34F8I9_9BILA
MGAGSSTNKGVASRSRYSSWGSSIDEAICGENALCGDYPDDDVEGFPLVSRAPSRRASVVTNPYIDATPRKQPRLRRAFSEGEASVRRAYTTDYSDNSDDPDTDDDYNYQNANMIRKSPPKQKLPKKKNRQRRRSSMPQPESNYNNNQRRYSMPETIPVTSHSRRFSAFDNDPFDGVDTPLYSQPIKKAAKKPKAKSIPNVAKYEDDDYLADYHLPSQVPSDSYYSTSKRGYNSAPLKPITKTRRYDKEPNYKVPTTPKSRRKKSEPRRPKKKAPSFPTPQYAGLPQQYDQILQSAPPIRKGARIKAPISQGTNYAPTPFIVGRAKHAKTPYLVSH